MIIKNKIEKLEKICFFLLFLKCFQKFYLDYLPCSVSEGKILSFLFFTVILKRIEEFDRYY